jgi:hypothetical protein
MDPKKLIEWIRTGVTREVLLVGRWALKVPKLTSGWTNFLYGLVANMREREYSAKEWPELCPVVFSVPGGWLIVMLRAGPLTDELLDRLDMVGFATPEDGRVLPIEMKGSSFGVLNGRIVVVDYGGK